MNADNGLNYRASPDAQDAPKRGRGRPKKSSDTLAKERENDVDQVSKILTGYVAIDSIHSIEYTDPTGKVVELQGNDLDLMTTKLSCEHGVFIPEMRVKAAVQYAANKNSYCPIREYLDRCAAQAIPHKD